MVKLQSAPVHLFASDWKGNNDIGNTSWRNPWNKWRNTDTWL